MRSVALWVSSAVVCVGAGTLALAGRDPGLPASRAGPTEAEPAPPRAPIAPVAVGFVGVIVPSEAVDVSARASGTLASVSVRLGERVKAGQELAQLDRRSVEAELEALRAVASARSANVQRALLEQRQARARYERRRSLANAAALVSDEELESSRYQSRLATPLLAAARAEAEESAARVQQLEQQRADARLTAPFDGIVAARYADPGAQVTSGSPVVRLISAEGTWVRFALPATFSRDRIAPGEIVLIDLGGGMGALTGTIETVAPEINPASRLVIAEARLSLNADEREKVLGRVVRVRTRGASSDSGLGADGSN